MEKRTKDPEKAFKYWSGGEEPPMDVHVVQGQYWESAHWTKEFELYIEIYAPRSWRDGQIKENELRRVEGELPLPENAPEWFKPEGNMELFKESPGNAAGIEMYMDTASGRLLIHALQL